MPSILAGVGGAEADPQTRKNGTSFIMSLALLFMSIFNDFKNKNRALGGSIKQKIAILTTNINTRCAN